MTYDVTIGIPVYRAEKFISKTMESALSQTYHNIEFLIVNDGSDDQSINIIEEIKSSHPRGKDIRILDLAINLGAYEARNLIIDKAQGTYLYFMDSDDIIEKNTIEMLMNEMKGFQADVVFGSYEKTELSGEKVLYQYPTARYETGDEFAIFAYRRYAGIQASACNFLVKLSLLRENGLRFCKSRFWEDTVFTLELVSYVHRVVLLPNITYYYLCRENSLTDIHYDDNIDKTELIQYLKTIDHLKQGKNRLKDKPYYPNWCYIAVMSDIYIICNILKRHHHIVPQFTNRELRNSLDHPASIFEIISFRQKRLQNLSLYLLGKFPAAVSIMLIKLLGKAKGLI